MTRFFERLGRYFLIFEVLVDYGVKVFWHKFLGGRKPFISPVELREILEDLGGGFLKFGQMAAVRPDYFPREYSRELLRLLDQVPEIDPEYVDKIFLSEYGKKPEKVFAKFERASISAASFGQVHRAWLESGEKVAVKIQRPFMAENFALDARFISFLAWLLKRTNVVRVVDPLKVVQEFVRWTERELDYLREAEHLSKLRDQAVRHGFNIKIPKVYSDLTTRKILVMEFIEGENLKWYYLRDEMPPGATELFKEGIFFELYSYLFKGFFHADPHPANLLITDEGGLAFVDAGIALEVKISDRKKMAKFLEAVVRENVTDAVAAFLEMANAPILKILKEAREAYPRYWMKIQLMKTIFLKKVKTGLSDVIERWHKAAREGGSIEEKSPMHKFMQLFQLADRAEIKMPESSVLFARTFLTIDVIVLELIPDLNIPAIINEFFEKYKAEFAKLLEIPDEVPFYMEPEFDSEWSEIFQSTHSEIKRREKELLMENASAIMETFEI